ncbi:unnamed protein product [Cyprideis torosa]|uniref:Presequence protease mitochondrial-type C-terminal domain-containing protein n=1 Tax=Cyprideis torosa TaxID=163714 RepID=A0A7R8ZVC4_9CRUS|nr:unnamed protein product [Cyprideis torosa]CAG0902421.1 unnamed protein product [Cyprideis torosa]
MTINALPSYAGLEFIQHLKKIVETDSYEATLDKIKQIGTHIWNKSTSMRGALNTTPDFMDSARGKLNDFICLLPGSVPESISPTVFLPPAVPFVPLAQKHHVVFPFPVNFSALTYPLPPYNHPDYPIARITAPLKGGAYGGGATLTSAGFTFYSYRDPNSLKTFETYQRGIDWLLAGNFNEDAIHEAKLSEFQKEDSPIPPGSQGMKLFLESLTPEMRNEQRERMIAVDKQQIVDFARRTFTKGTLSSACLIGPETKEKEKGWTVVNEQG